MLFVVPNAAGPVAKDRDAPVPLHVAGLPEADARAAVAAVPGAVWEPDPARARLVWEYRKVAPRLVTGLNMFVSFDMPRGDLPAAVAKIRAADALGRLAAAGALKITRDGEGGNAAPAVYIAGSRVRLSIEGLPGPNLVVFNLAADGRVQFLYPEARDRPIAWPTRRFELFDVDARKPFGGDHVVAVASGKKLAELADAIRALDDQPKADAARRAVERALAADGTAIVAVTAVFTVPAELRCDPEVIRDAAMLGACPRR